MSKDNDPVSQVEKTIKKYKRRAKRLLCCGIVWLLIAILCLIIGIVMLVYFSEYWSNEENWRRGLAYFGVALLIIFLISIVIAVVVFVIMRIIYKRLDNPNKEMKMFRPPTYAYGEAPYPQQPPESGSMNSSPSHPLQPPVPGVEPTAPPAGAQEVHIEVDEHKKF